MADKMIRKITIILFMLFLQANVCFALDTVKLVKSTIPSVVVIEVFDSNNNFAGSGSGFFVTKNGDILTNAHVISAGDKYVVYTNDNNSFEGQIKALHREQDMALISIRSNKYPPLNFGDTTPQAGSYAIAIGAPLGLMNTVSDGLVSGVKTHNSYHFLQVSCPISPGSSGGPVINDQGSVIGMSTFILTEGSNLSFCVPAKQMKMFVNQAKGLPAKEPSIIKAQNPKPITNHNQAEKNKPAERYVFMVKDDNNVDGYIAIYLDTHSVEHKGSIISCVLVSKLGNKLSHLFSKNGVLAETQVSNFELNPATRSYHVVRSVVHDSKGNVLHVSEEQTQWVKIQRGTPANELLSYVLLTGL